MFIGFRIKHWVKPLMAVAGVGAVVIARSDAGRVIAAAGRGAWKSASEKLSEVREEHRIREQAYREYSKKGT